jgi:hypothetical protein
VSVPLRGISAVFRRKLLAQPGIGALPVCGACNKQVRPRDFGREFCKACEAERAEVADYWQAQIDATLTNEPTRPAEPMLGSEEAGRPFFPDDEEEGR